MTKRDWYHEVSVPWLEARRTVLTATEIKKLVPEWKRMLKKPGELSLGFAALWGEKNSFDWPLDPASYGPAARGHWMEPFAIDEYNDANRSGFRHWDDCIICRGVVGFSPDGMDIAQTSADVKLDVVGSQLMSGSGDKMPAPKAIIEVKSYEPAGHTKAVFTKKGERDEEMQIAVAFHVLPTLESATLLFFNPSHPVPMYAEQYTRDDLVDKIIVVEAIADMYEETAERCEKLARVPLARPKVTEDDVWHEFMRAMESDRNVFSVRGGAYG